MRKTQFMSMLLAGALAAGTLFGCASGGKSTGKTEQASDASTSAEKADSKSAEASGTPLADVRVRQALAYAIDMDTIVNSLFEGKADVAKSFTAPGDWLNADIPEYKYDPEKAKELLKEANWPKDYTLDVVYYYDDQQTVLAGSRRKSKV